MTYLLLYIIKKYKLVLSIITVGSFQIHVVLDICRTRYVHSSIGVKKMFVPSVPYIALLDYGLRQTVRLYISLFK